MYAIFSAYIYKYFCIYYPISVSKLLFYWKEQHYFNAAETKCDLN